MECERFFWPDRGDKAQFFALGSSSSRFCLVSFPDCSVAYQSRSAQGRVHFINAITRSQICLQRNTQHCARREPIAASIARLACSDPCLLPGEIRGQPYRFPHFGERRSFNHCKASGTLT